MMSIGVGYSGEFHSPVGLVDAAGQGRLFDSCHDACTRRLDGRHAAWPMAVPHASHLDQEVAQPSQWRPRCRVRACVVNHVARS